MFGKLVCSGILGAAVFLALGGGASAAQRSACSTGGLVATHAYKVVSLRTSGVPCSKARTVAQQVADELMQGRPVSISGVEGLALATTSCTGCTTTTQVALSYPNGKITISLGGRPAASPSTVTGSGPLIRA
jgi:hypothetical protein